MLETFRVFRKALGPSKQGMCASSTTLLFAQLFAFGMCNMRSEVAVTTLGATLQAPLYSPIGWRASYDVKIRAEPGSRMILVVNQAWTTIYIVPSSSWSHSICKLNTNHGGRKCFDAQLFNFTEPYISYAYCASTTSMLYGPIWLHYSLLSLMEKENLLKPEFKDSWNVPSVPDPSQNHPGTKPCISTQRVLVILLLISCSANVIQSGYILIQGLPRSKSKNANQCHVSQKHVSRSCITDDQLPCCCTKRI